MEYPIYLEAEKWVAMFQPLEMVIIDKTTLATDRTKRKYTAHGFVNLLINSEGAKVINENEFGLWLQKVVIKTCREK